MNPLHLIFIGLLGCLTEVYFARKNPTVVRVNRLGDLLFYGEEKMTKNRDSFNHSAPTLYIVTLLRADNSVVHLTSVSSYMSNQAFLKKLAFPGWTQQLLEEANFRLEVRQA